MALCSVTTSSSSQQAAGETVFNEQKQTYIVCVTTCHKLWSLFKIFFFFVHRAQPLTCPGSDLEGVKLLQSYEDAKDIYSSSLGQKVVVTGASFIGY